MAQTDKQPLNLLRLIVILLLLLSIVFFRPWPWDATTYHLPFAARTIGLTSYTNISPLHNPRFEGFPMLWRYLLAPGLILDAPRLFIIPNFCAALIMAWTCAYILSLPWYLSIASTLCYPIAIIGFASPYQDYFVNTIALCGALFLFKSLFDAFSGATSINQRNLWLGTLLLSLSANTKVQGLLLASVILFTFVAYLAYVFYFSPRMLHTFYPISRLFSQKKTLLHLLTVVTVISIFFQPISNLILYQNPFYPFKAFGLHGAERTYSTPIEYLPSFPVLTNLTSHFISASEIDPYILPNPKAAPPLMRSLAMGNTRRPYHNAPNEVRTGGTFGPIYAGLLVLVALSVIREFSHAGPGNLFFRHLSAFLLFACLLVATLPQSHELRYYLFALFVPSLLSLSMPSSPFVKLITRRLVLLGLLLGLLHLSVHGKHLVFSKLRSFQVSANPFNLKAELPSARKCISLGVMKTHENGEKALILNSKNVTENIPFQCRLVLSKDIYIQYIPQANKMSASE